MARPAMRATGAPGRSRQYYKRACTRKKATGHSSPLQKMALAQGGCYLPCTLGPFAKTELPGNFRLSDR